MAQGLQLTHLPVFLAGHVLFSILLPLSIIKTFSFGFNLVASKAVNIPAGPAPTIIKSYIFFMDDPPLTYSSKGIYVSQYKIRDRKSTRLNSSHANISYAVFCLKKKIRE